MTDTPQANPGISTGASDHNDRWAGMTPFQIGVIAICFAINMLDGFDILAMAFAAPNIAKDWQLAPATLGGLFSAGLGGMVAGSILLGLLADRLGRRPIILLSLVLAAVGMTLAARADGIRELATARILTGFAVGGIGPCLNSLVAEYASISARTFCVAFMQAGFALGSALGGLAAIGILEVGSWRGIFYLGAGLTAALLPLSWRFLPESLAFLHLRPRRAVQAEAISARVRNIAPSASTGVQAEKATRLAQMRAHCVPLVTAILIFFLSIMSFYFINSWTPKILADSGLPISLSLLGGIALSSGGIFAAMAVGAFARHFSVTAVIAVATLGTAVLTMVFGQIQGDAGQVLTMAFVLGLFINTTQVGVYAILAGLFPPTIRTGATGLAVGLGRFGSVAGPWVAGLMIEAGWSAKAMFATMAAPYLLAALLIWQTGKFRRY